MDSTNQSTDLRVVEGGKAILPKNLVYLSAHEGKVAAVKYQLGKGVLASTFAEMGCDVYARMKPEWVEAGKKDVSY